MCVCEGRVCAYEGVCVFCTFHMTATIIVFTNLLVHFHCILEMEQNDVFGDSQG